MSVALVIVHKQLGGHKWSNTHCVRIGTDQGSIPTDADLTTAGAASTFTDANTNASPTNILQAIVAFERNLANADVIFTDVLITDGKRASGLTPTATEYAAISLPALAGVTRPTQGAAIAVGAVDLLVHRNVVGFGHKPGRMYVRALLLDTEVENGGPRMLQFSGTSQAGYNTIVATAQGKLTPYLFGGANAATAMMCLPIYITPKQQTPPNPTLPPVGSLVGSIPIGSYSSVGPVIRQVPRGRKRKKAA